MCFFFLGKYGINDAKGGHSIAKTWMLLMHEYVWHSLIHIYSFAHIVQTKRIERRKTIHKFDKAHSWLKMPLHVIAWTKICRVFFFCLSNYKFVVRIRSINNFNSATVVDSQMLYQRRSFSSTSAMANQIYFHCLRKYSMFVRSFALQNIHPSIYPIDNSISIRRQGFINIVRLSQNTRVYAWHIENMW